MGRSQDIPHPGRRIRDEVIPKGMTVSAAAKLIGVGRPALSNLLNGKAALSIDMAARLENAFNYPRQRLMEMQAQFEAAQAKLKAVPAGTRACVPPFLGIKAIQIEQWVTRNIPARTRLAVFLRTLVHSTGRGLTKVDFPGNDDAERPGWDGFVEAGEGAAWVPVGRSGWEFGSDEDIKGKADSDFAKRLKEVDPHERAATSFVFVTPRHWAGKNKWEEAAKARRLWQDVRVYDSDDIEQWLEQSLPGQVWFANETHIPAQDVRTLDKCWADWANVSTLPLSAALFASAIEAAKRSMIRRLSNPPRGPILIAADSTDEAVALLAQLFGERGGEELAAHRDRVLVFDKPGTLPRLAAGAESFLPVVSTRDVERELAPFADVMHSIVVYPRNAIGIEPDIVLEPASYDTFETALKEMAKDRDEITRLANESGRSLTVLRRRLATVPAVRKPEWAADRGTARSLIPLLWVGAWNITNESDVAALELLAGGRPYGDVEKDCQSLVQLNDAPLWSIGSYRGVISKIDLLFAIASDVTPDDLKLFFSVAQIVLGEDDPSLDLEEHQRWAASIYGKSREFSAASRNGISETLVLLAVHGGQLFKSRLGVDTQVEAARVVRDLLTPLTTRVLDANERDLPTYAEAAPDEFLSILERDLASPNPAVLGLLRPVSPEVFGSHPYRTGLLWALEGLSWSPETLPRAALILARLAQVEINDNWVDKPIHSLECIFRAWMPQTAADHQQRVNVVKKVVEKFPEIGWKICVAQFGAHHQMGDYSHKPRWRPDGYGFGEPFPTWGPILDFKREMVEMALNWNEYTVDKLGDLVERLPDLDKDYQRRVWALIEAWAGDSASDADKAVMREKIRVSTLSRRAALRSKRDVRMAAVTKVAEATYAALEPRDILNKYAWLFRSTWVEESASEIEDIEKVGYQEREERIKRQRVEALRQIHEQLGVSGFLELSSRGQTSAMIGWLAASEVLPGHELHNLLELALTPILAGNEEAISHKNLIGGALRAIESDKDRETTLKSLAVDLTDEDAAQLLLLAPYRKSTWTFVDGFSEAAQAKYWSEVVPEYLRGSDAEVLESIERLLRAGRPRAAFVSTHLNHEALDPEVLYRLLMEMAKGGNDRDGEYLPDPYDIDTAFERIRNSSALSIDQKAGLEFTFIEVLTRPTGMQVGESGIPNLERYIELHPEQYVQAVAWTYKRKDGKTDPEELQTPSEAKHRMAELGHKLLESIRRIPGLDDLGVLRADHLTQWIDTVRQSCADLARADVADRCLGGLLANAPDGNDGIWPCEPVRQVMEDVGSESIMEGVRRGVYNARGVHFRGEGGDLERELAAKYRKWGQALQTSHPFISSRLLFALAEAYEHEAHREDLEASIRRRMG